VLFDAVSKECKRISASGDVQAMSNISWAFAKLDYKAAGFFEEVADQHKRIIASGDVQVSEPRAKRASNTVRLVV